MQFKLLSIFVFLFIFNTKAQEISLFKTIDSIQQLRELIYDSNLNIEEKLIYAKRASALSYKTGIDSVILESDNKLAYVYLISNDMNAYILQHQKNLKLAYKIEDLEKIATSSSNLGWYYHTSETHNDSAYYYYNISLNVYKKLNNKLYEAEVLVNLSHLKVDENDFAGGENNIMKAISLIKELTETAEIIDNLYISYNLLGTLNNRMGRFENAFNAYQKALAYNNRLPETFNSNIKKTNLLYTTINIAEVYKATKSFKKSKTIYQDLLKDSSLTETDPETYATILNNLAFVKFLDKDSDNSEIIAMFNNAYLIFKNQHALYEISSAGNDMSEFYLSLGQNDSAIHYLEHSYKIARQAKENKEVLRSLKLLSKAKEGEAGKAYLYEYINLNDSILHNERNMRNKFAAIQFETKEIQDINKKITRDNKLLIITVIALLTSLLFIFISFSQRAKNKRLVFEREQQIANENIYALMLDQKTKLEESRIQERNRISEELHDGILSKLFGSRLGLEYLLMQFKGDPQTSKKYKDYINAIQSVELEIRDVSHELRHELFSTRSDFKFIIKDYIKELGELHLFNYTIQFGDSIFWEDINEGLKVNLYRIIQETLQNTIKHAEAETIAINFSLQKKHLILTIVDDGVGFDLRQRNNGIGLKNMKSRIHKLKGDFQIKTELAKGTTTIVTIPIN